jgi:hypothetical protein
MPVRVVPDRRRYEEAGNNIAKRRREIMQGSQVRTILAKMPTLSLVKPAAAGKKSRPLPSSSQKKSFTATRAFRLKTLAEAVILQAMEDLWSDTHREKSIEFFEGNGFTHFASLAGMGAVERLRLGKMLGRLKSDGVKPSATVRRAASL